jgi:peptidoglycan/LPS O-acetylase OafA/YrhL
VAVAAGFFTTAVLSLGGDLAFRAMSPAAFAANGQARDIGVLIFVLAYTAAFGIAGGYVAARFADRRPVAHALALGIVALIISTVITIFAWSTRPAWYHIMALLLVLPAALLGGKLRELQSA